MFKRILKIMAIVLGIFVVVIGASVGIYALSGGFTKKEIDIIKLYMDDDTKASKEIYTLSDFSAVVNCEPLTATNNELKVICEDPLSPKDSQGNAIKDGILKNVPKTITAGKAFNIEINKDEKGNNIGGVVTLKFIPSDSEKTIADFTLKVIVDVAIPDNSLFFSGNKSDKYNSLTGKTITMGINNTQQYIYLKSDLVNAFFLQANNQNLKKALISYTYTTLTGDLVETKTFDDLQYDYIYNNETRQYNYFYKVPVTPRKSGKIVITAKMHRTYQIEQDYIAGDFDNMQYPTVYTTAHDTKLSSFNDFLNKYIEFFDTTEQSYEFFRTYLTNDGKIRLTKESWNSGAVERAKEFIFQSCNSTVNISAVNLKDISSIDEAKSSDEQVYFDVFSSKSYNINELIKSFDLKVRLEEDNESTSIANIDDEKANLFSTLQVTPYIYIDKSVFAYGSTYTSPWANYQDILLVTGFENKQPVYESIGDDAYDEQFMLSGEYIKRIIDDNYYKGFLVNLSSQFKDRTYKDFVTVTLGSSAQDRTWNISFNVPLSQGIMESLESVTKALFLQFKVTGRNLETGEEKSATSYSRISIGYRDFQLKDGIDNIQFQEGSIKRMYINNGVNGISTSVEDEGKYVKTQPIYLDLNALKKDNTLPASYTSVMYFVEKNSNSLDNNGGAKLATIGNYSFKYMDAQQNTDGEWVDDVKFNDNPLIGQRIPLFSDSGEFCQLKAINASYDPAYVFAVIYLSDANGNPIDTNGRLIKIDESSDSVDPTTLYVFKITNVGSSDSMTKVYIDNFVDNMNYYTTTKQSISIEQTSQEDGAETESKATYSVSEGNLFKRNNISKYVDPETKVEFNREKLEELQKILKLKLLKNNRFTLYATNFEVVDKDNFDGDAKKYAGFEMKDFYDKKVTKEFEVNVYQNKQLALNKFLGIDSGTKSNEQILEDVTNNYSLNLKCKDYKLDVKLWMVDDTIVGFVFEIVVSDEKLSSDDSADNSGDYIYIKAKTLNNKPLVTNALTTSDAVNWEVNDIKVESVELQAQTGGVDINRYEKLTSRYTDAGSKTQDFGRLTDNGKTWTEFILYSFDSNTQGNLAYVIKTNLYDNQNSAFNTDIIDYSQMIYMDSSTEGNNISTSTFKDIESYISHFTQDTNNITISYHNPNGIVGLITNLVFQNNNGDHRIYVNDTSFEITDLNSSELIDGKLYDHYIVAEGIKYGVVRELTVDNTVKYTCTIEAGRYFPTTNRTTSNGTTTTTTTYAIIMGQEFEILSNGQTNTISNIVNQNGNRRETSVTLNFKLNGSDTNYESKNYIQPVDSDSGDSNVIDTTTTGNVTYAKVNFVKGGTQLDSDGKYIFVRDNTGKYTFEEDENGEYYFDGKKGNYVINNNAQENEIRFNKRGIIAYVVVTYNISGTIINKVLTYELIQEPITLVARSKDTAFKLENNYSNMSIQAGQEIQFNLGVAEKVTKIESGVGYDYAIHVLGSTIESSFFKHCTFEALSGGLKFKDSNGNSTTTISKPESGTLTLVIPDSYQSSLSATIKISYPNEEGTTVDKELLINITPTPGFEFGMKSNAGLTFDSDKKVFRIEGIKSGTTPSISEFMRNYFDYNTDSTVTLTQVNDGNYNTGSLCTIDGDTLTIAESYVKKGENHQLLFNIAITNKEGDSIDLTERLCIVVKPDYVIDFDNVENKTISILNGQSLFNQYISIYSYNDSGTLVEVTDKNNIDKVYARLGLTVGGTTYENGVVNISDKYFDTNTYSATITLKSGVENQELTTTINFELIVVGYELYFDQGGGYTLPEGERFDMYDDIKDKSTPSVSGTLTLEYSETDTINLDKYFAVFSKENKIKTNIYAVLKDSSGKIVHDIKGPVDGAEYTLCFATMKQDDTSYVKLIETDITVTLQATANA